MVAAALEAQVGAQAAGWTPVGDLPNKADRLEVFSEGLRAIARASGEGDVRRGAGASAGRRLARIEESEVADLHARTHCRMAVDMGCQ